MSYILVFICDTTNHLLPFLTLKQRKMGVEWTLSQLADTNTDPSSMADSKFRDIYDVIDTDEKWFWLCKDRKKYFIFKGEEDKIPARKCKSKRFLQKVHFFCAVACPRYDYTTKSWFDGKLLMEPFVEKVPAKRNSVNRKAGTLVTTPVSVTASVHRAMVLDHLLPAIKEKWKGSTTKQLFIQEDNAPPHSAANERIIAQEDLLKHNLHVKMVKQAPSSPSFNYLDAGIFNSIQKKVHSANPRSVDDLIQCVISAFNGLHRNVIDDTFLSVQSSMKDCLKVDGDNTVPLGHMGKGKLCRGGSLPIVLSVEHSLVCKAYKFLEGCTDLEKVNSAEAAACDADDSDSDSNSGAGSYGF